MAFKVTPPSEQYSDYWTLWRESKKRQRSPAPADLFARKLLKGQFLVLKNNFNLKTMGLYRDDKPMIMATHYQPHLGWPGPECLGAFAISPEVSDGEIKEFWSKVKNETRGRQLVAPLNGHHYLGFSLPSPGTDPKKIGILNSSTSPELERLFGKTVSFSIYRRYYSFETEVSQSLKVKLSQESKTLPKDMTVRSFSKWNAKRDLATLNRLVNSNFTEHFDFCPLSDSENYEIMKMSVPLFGRGHFNFLEHKGSPIGFCMSMKDYHQIWDNGPDWKNISSLLLHGKKIKRARAMHIAIDKKYRGQKLTKYLRHRTFLKLIDDDIQYIENSYIDEGNVASKANVQSTGAQPLHQFHLFQINT